MNMLSPGSTLIVWFLAYLDMGALLENRTSGVAEQLRAISNNVQKIPNLL